MPPCASSARAWGGTRVLVVTVLVAASAVVVALSPAASYGVRAATALGAAAVLLRAARQRDALRRARCAFAAALLVGASAGVSAVVQLAVTGTPAQPGQLPDVLYLSYVPLAVVGLLAVPARRGGRVRALADGVVAAASLWYVAQLLVVEPNRLAEGLPWPARTAIVAYVLLPPFVVAVLLSVLPRAVPEARRFLLWAAAGMTASLGADAAYAVAVHEGTYRADSPIAALNQVGLALVLVAACTGLGASPARPPSWRWPRVSSATAEAVLPYVPLLAAVAVTGRQVVQGGGLTRAALIPTMVIALTVSFRHATWVWDHATLVSALEQRERDARAEALRDPLTGLGNRTAFREGLARRLADPGSHPVAVALLDLDDFKDVNDTHGHETGDELIMRCADALWRAVPDGSVVARLGGDEFAVCQPRATDGGSALLAAVAQAFDGPVVLGARHFAVRASVGVVVDERAPGGGTSPDDATRLLAHADIAMYSAKRGKSGRGPSAVVLRGEARHRATAVIRLREEVSRPDLTQFRVLYQPVVDLDTGVVSGVEALLRWHHPELGEVSPAVFVPLAEQVGSVEVLGAHVLATAVRDLATWRALDPSAVRRVGVNLSPRQLADPSLPTRVLDLLAREGLPPSSLVLEITEGAFVEDLDTAVRIVAELRAHDVSVAVDDFGTGYSSLRYLRRFAADVVKIDQEFVQALPTEPQTAELVRSVVDMASALRLGTVAEGIETLDQLRVAQSLGCQRGQGYLFSPAVEAAAIARLVVDRHVYPVGAAAPAAPARRPPVPAPRSPVAVVDLPA